MANDIDANVYLDNNDLIVCTPVERSVNGISGAVEETALEGLTLKYYLATAEDTEDDGDAVNAALVVTLVEGPAGVYVGTMTGASKRTHLAALADDSDIWRHWQAGTQYHVATRATLRKTRPVEDDA